jgi:hypothetical protein
VGLGQIGTHHRPFSAKSCRVANSCGGLSHIEETGSGRTLPTFIAVTGLGRISRVSHHRHVRLRGLVTQSQTCRGFCASDVSSRPFYEDWDASQKSGWMLSHKGRNMHWREAWAQSCDLGVVPGVPAGEPRHNVPHSNSYRSAPGGSRGRGSWVEKVNDEQLMFVAMLCHGSFSWNARVPRRLSPVSLGLRRSGLSPPPSQQTACTLHAAQNGSNRAGSDNADWVTKGWLLTCIMLEVSES